MVRNIAGIWLILFLCSLPFPFELLPELGKDFSGLLFPLVTIFASLLNVELVHTWSSDSVIYYIQAIPVLFISILIYWLITKLRKNNIEHLSHHLHVVISIALSFFLFKYGFIKIFQHQFYTIEPNIAHTPVGQLSKDILFWSSMSTSKFYNLFMGVTEIIAGMLLLFHRFRFLGSIIAVGIFSHVLAINIGFDISVKLLAFSLLISSLYVLGFYRHLLRVFVGKSNTKKYPTHHTIFANPYITNVLKGVVVATLLMECLYVYTKPITDNSKLVGSYIVDEHFPIRNASKVHITSSDYCVTQNDNDVFSDYKMRHIASAALIEINKVRYNYRRLSNENLILEWNENGSKKECKLVRLSNENLPVYQDEFHLTMENYLSNSQ